jgi:hypothetical protein
VAGLLEAVASLGISGAVVALMSASMTSAVRIQNACIAFGDEMFERRQLEHLVDRAVTAAGAGPSSPGAVASTSFDTVVFASDHDGDGIVDLTSAETTALEVRQSSGDARVRLRFGRQTMTVLEVPDSEATLAVLDRGGGSAVAATASLVEVTIVPDDVDAAPARMLFSLPPASPAP